MKERIKIKLYKKKKYNLFIILKYWYKKSPWSDSDSLSYLLFSVWSECDTLFTLQCSFQWRERAG